MDLGLTERVYVVSGGTRGLGFAVAQALVDEGARVVASGRDPAALAAAIDRLGEHRATGVRIDNSDPTCGARLVDSALERWGRLDGALINGGGPPVGYVADLSDDLWRKSFETVFLGAVRAARVIGEALRSGGSLAFVLSTSVRTPIANLDMSNGLRPGLAMVAKSMANQLGGRGIRVNALLPGRITTERTAYYDAHTASPDAVDAAIAAIPLGRAGTPSEFGSVAAFVLSPAASYLNGAMIPVDGGATPSY